MIYLFLFFGVRDKEADDTIAKTKALFSNYHQHVCIRESTCLCWMFFSVMGLYSLCPFLSRLYSAAGRSVLYVRDS
jgi:hypothetical protein